MDKFFSKVLLFGEYSIIKGSYGLAIPYDHFYGELIIDQQSCEEGLSLLELSNYLSHSSILKKNINVENFAKDVKAGLCFKSNIPQGYGVGSSGALCASILSKYGRNIKRSDSFDDEDLYFLQDLMALMESYYHGTSSGLDPLISFINTPVYIKSRNEFCLNETPKLSELGEFYLIDTGIPRKTSPLVHKFMKMCEDEAFNSKLESLVSNTNLVIESFLNKDKDKFNYYFHEISRFQYLYFEKMIPKEYKELWLKGLETKDFYIKLCGAGGGGFLMAYSPGKINDLDNLKTIKLS